MTMKSGRIPVSNMALQIAMNSQGWPMQSLKPTAVAQIAQLRDEVHHRDRILERGMARRRDAVDAERYAARFRDLRRHLGGRQHAAVAGLGALRQLDLDHLDLRVLRLRGKAVGRERAVVIAAAEIAAAELPDQVAAELAVITADAAFASVVREPSKLGPLIEGANGIGTERAEAHGGDVEQRE